MIERLKYLYSIINYMAKKIRLYPNEEFLLAQRVDKVLSEMYDEKDRRVPEYIQLLDKLLEISNKQFNEFRVKYEQGEYSLNIPNYRTPSRDILNYMEDKHPDLYCRVLRDTTQYRKYSDISIYSPRRLFDGIKTYLKSFRR